MPVRLLVVALAALALPAPATAHRAAPSPLVRAASVHEPCPGDAIRPDRVITGSFRRHLAGSYVMVPFRVPRGTTAVRVKYCFDQPELGGGAAAGHTIDLGLWDPRRFRGWGGSSHPDVTVSRQGFSSEARYLARPQGHVPGRTTRGFLPGPLPVGRWHVELGAMAIAGPELGDPDGSVAWRVELELSDDPRHGARPYRPARYETRPARSRPGWYAGDLHVHAEHSALGDATMRETFDYAFGPAGLDFVTLSDYVTSSAWGEIGRHQPRHPGRLIARSSEIVTPRGHANNHVSARYVDHRTGPVHERRSDGSLRVVREATPASRLFRAIHRGGGFTQINHPTIFPSSVPAFALLCRGCPWDHGARSTRYGLVDAIEVATGPAGVRDAGGTLVGPNPFTVTAIDFYERALARGAHVAAVGASDSHHAGEPENPATQAPIGMATTVVRAPELSERGIRCGVRRGHTYVKIWGADRPDLRLVARPVGGTGVAIFGDTVRGGRARFEARVLGADATHQLQVVRDGVVVRIVPVTGPRTVARWSGGPGRYRLQLMRGTSIEGVSTPVWVQAAGRPSVAPREPCALGAAAQPRAAPRFTG